MLGSYFKLILLISALQTMQYTNQLRMKTNNKLYELWMHYRSRMI